MTGKLKPGVAAKDIILALIGKIGVDGGTGHVIEYRGETISNLSMEERMTICNMSIEAGARAGMIAPDEKTFEFLKGRPRAPAGADWDKAVERWRKLCSDPDAHFDKEVDLDVSNLEPQVTYGTNPGMVVPITQRIPADNGEASFRKALEYMQLEPEQPVLGTKVDVVFVGSCTNSRMSDLRAVANILEGQQVASSVRMLIVPGSQAVKEQAEAEGLDKVFCCSRCGMARGGLLYVLRHEQRQIG